MSKGLVIYSAVTLSNEILLPHVSITNYLKCRHVASILLTLVFQLNGQLIILLEQCLTSLEALNSKCALCWCNV